MRKSIILLIVAIVVLATVLIAPWISIGKIGSATELSDCLPIYRGKYPFRHWTWSGIFPFYGGFIPDPHFSCSELVTPPKSVQAIVGDPEAKYQIIEVNNAFEDRTSEVLLALLANNHVYEFELSVPQNENAILASPMYPEARLFPNDGSIGVLTHFMETRRIYIISASLDYAQPLEYFDWQQNDARSLIEEFSRAARSDEDIRQHFCGPPSNPFISFYERFVGPCSPDGQSSGIQFDKFW